MDSELDDLSARRRTTAGRWKACKLLAGHKVLIALMTRSDSFDSVHDRPPTHLKAEGEEHCEPEWINFARRRSEFEQVRCELLRCLFCCAANEAGKLAESARARRA